LSKSLFSHSVQESNIPLRTSNVKGLFLQHGSSTLFHAPYLLPPPAPIVRESLPLAGKRPLV